MSGSWLYVAGFAADIDPATIDGGTMAAPRTITPLSEERLFELHELFFSTTDKAGVIRYGNGVFSRVAHYSLEEMVGRPHNIIRHPDMPKCAFRLVWDYLERGRIVGAYVKNLASDGRFYWVVALIMPTPDGYLSIRLKPSSAVFPMVQGVYAAALRAEEDAKRAGKSNQEQMDAGAAVILEALGSLGFASYDEFLRAMVAAELTSRAAGVGNRSGACERAMRARGGGGERRLVDLLGEACAIGQRLSDVVTRPGGFSTLQEQIIPKSRFILDLGESIRLFAVNSQIQAARLGDSARAMAVVSGQVAELADRGAETISRLNETLHGLVEPIAALVFDVMIASVQIEMAAMFVDEILGAGSEDRGVLDENLEVLFRTFLDHIERVPESLGRLQAGLRRIDDEIARLHTMMRTMRYVYLGGKIEVATYTERTGYSELFTQLQKMIEEAEGALADLHEHVVSNRGQVHALHSVDAEAAARIRGMLASAA